MKNLLKMKKLFYTLAVLIGLLGVSENANAADWASLGETIADGGRYVVYSPFANKFLHLGLQLVDEPAEATVYTFTANEAKYIMTYDDNGTPAQFSLSDWYQTDIYVLPQENNYYKIAGGTGYYSDVLDALYSGYVSWGSYSTEGVNWLLISEATYLAQGKRLYYAASGEVNRGGSVKVAFDNTVLAAATDSKNDSTAKTFASVVPVTAYFQAIPDDGYEFIGWKKSPTGGYVSFEETYSEEFEVTSTSEASPTTLTMYAYFQKESDKEAELLDVTGGSVMYDYFTDAYADADNGYTIVLYKNVDLENTLVLSKNITVDFNNYTFRLKDGETASPLVRTTANVTFSDNSAEGAGGISLSDEAALKITALEVASGKLNFDGGVVRANNISADEAAKATGVFVASNATLNLQGGKIIAEVAQNACGLEVPASATANLSTGSITAKATATNYAYGVTTSGAANISWSVAITATATGENAVGVLVNANTTISGGTIVATAASDAFGVQVQSGTTNISKNAAVRATTYALKQEGTGKINVTTGRFYSENTQDIIGSPADTTNLKLSGGYYAHSVELSTYKRKNVKQSDIKEGTKFYAEGYRYMLSDGENPNYVVASARGEGFTKFFGTLQDAILYANNNPGTTMTIRLEVPEYTLPAGNYTIPANATLLLPKDEEQVSPLVIIDRYSSSGAGSIPTLFQKLTLASGVHIDVAGAIEVGGRQHSYGQTNGTGRPNGPYYSQLDMQNGSQIVLGAGSTLYAWGFVTGAGTIDVRGGATVREQFQFYDFKGGTATGLYSSSWKNARVFPFHQYFIQNVEVCATYHPGSSLYTATGAVGAAADNLKIIGVEGDDACLFMMNATDVSEDTWIKKYYDIANDRQVYEVNNAAKISNIKVQIGSGWTGAEFDSKNYILPITNNMYIHLKSGTLNITQDVMLLPGAVIEVDKQASVVIDATKSLYVLDYHQWGKYSSRGSDSGATYASRIIVRPGGAPTNANRDISSAEKLGNAKLNIHGTLDVKGYLYTTAGTEGKGGAEIYSTNADAGTVIFTTAAPSEDGTFKMFISGTRTFGDFAAVPAPLLNGDDSYTDTKGAAAANDSYCYVGGSWKKLVANDCFVIDKTDQNNWKYLAKPHDYVELDREDEDNTTHLYYYHQGEEDERMFICLWDKCEWWEVESVEENDALVHCTHPDNDKYYYYDEDNSEWKEKRFTVTWVTKPYEELVENQGRVVYPVDYKATPKYLGTNPSRPMTDYYTYDFIGWLPEIVPVTDDAVYVAQFQQNDRKYLITFLDEDGSVLEEALWKMGDVPAPVNEPTPSGKKLVWEPTIQAVTGEATYRATYTDIVLPSYQITFKNWDGTQLQQSNVATNTLPEYTGDTPTKPSLADVGFEFEGWTPDLAPVSENAIYTAKFREIPATYTITFKRAVGNEGVAIEPAETIQELELAYGETPVCTSDLLPTKTSTAAEYYTLVWSPLITAVTGNATYTATGFAAHKNTCRLTVSAGANGKVSLDGSEDVLSAVYEYGNTATILATPTTTGYRFVRWSDGNTTNPRTVTVNAAISLTAEFALNQYTITWNNEDNSLIEQTVVNHGVVPSHVAPTKATDASNTYSFAGWTPTPVAATTNTTYTATFNATPIEYTIRIVLNNGMSDIVYEGKHYNDEITIGTPVKAPKNGVSYTFSHWTNSADENIGTTIPNVTRNEVYYAQYETQINDLKAGNSENANAKDLSLTENGMEAQTLTIEPSGTVNITSDAAVTVQSLIIESNGTTSGQLLGTSSARLTINEKAYFDLALNAERRTWYAVAVPWAVDCRTGISIKGGRRLVLGRDFDLVYYQGDVRASQGAGAHCWKYAEDGDGDKIMHPGRLYMMYFGSEIETIRFENYDDTPFDDAVLTVTPYAASGTDDANWNGVANPQVYHATLSAGGATYGYYLNNGKVDEYMVGEGEPTYKLVNLASYNAIVGKPLFIQAVNNTSIATTPKIAAAPRRIREIEIEEGIETVYEVTFGAEGSANKDNIFIQTVETKEDGYVLGQDLLKAGMSTKLPQMWINRYDKKLSVNTATPVNGVHEYPLTLNIPLTGDYTIAIESTQGDTEALYLTKNGNVIWNLSNGAYTASFEKGTDASYGLRTSAKAPQISTGIDNAVADANGEIRKVLINDHVYIIRGNEVYTIEGQLVK